ncbi:MAG TPA: C39 family peptidase [Terriglobales bacterium]|nr:C39 family peptidase [Terriglobales bacterium]
MRCSTVKSVFGILVFSLLVHASGMPGVWLDVPFVKQEKNGCGAASIAMVMQYWQRQQSGAPVIPDASEIQKTLYSAEAKGILASEMEHYLKEHGFRVFVFTGRLDDLQQHIAKGRPLIVALKPSTGSRALHYVVIAGFDSGAGIVLKNDPAERKLLRQSFKDFEHEWQATGNWTLLAVPLETPTVATYPAASH